LLESVLKREDRHPILSAHVSVGVILDGKDRQQRFSDKAEVVLKMREGSSWYPILDLDKA
jgi:hypothetical protein